MASSRSHDWQAPSHGHSSLHASTRALARSAQNFAGQCDDSKVDYELDVAAANVLIACTQRMSVVVNGSPVGPVLHFQEGQTSKIRVRNNVIGNKFIKATDVIMHWHGLDVDPWMDGSPVSQWPIKSGGCFQYEITPKAGSAGSYLYHDHAMKSFAATTVTGAIIVEDAPGKKPSFLDNVEEEEQPIFISESYSKSDADIEKGLTQIPYSWSGEPANILINGKGYTSSSLAPKLSDSCTIAIFRLSAGKTFRFRFISGTVLSYLYFSLQGHKMKIIEADGGYVEPLETFFLHVASGQRYSVLITAKSEKDRNDDKKNGISKYWLQGATVERATRHTVLAAFYYDDVAPLPNEVAPADTQRQISGKYTSDSVFQSKLTGLTFPTFVREDYDLRPWTKYTNFPGRESVADTIIINSVEAQVDASGKTISTADAGWWSPKYVVQWFMNDRTWSGPRSNYPTLNAFYDLADRNLEAREYIPNDDGYASPKHYDSVNNLYAVQMGDIIDVIIHNGVKDYSASDAHPYHWHGAHYWDLGHGPGSYTDQARDDNDKAIKEGKRTPLLRDTSVLYRYHKNDARGGADGWRAFRMKVTSPGVWLLHCHGKLPKQPFLIFVTCT